MKKNLLLILGNGFSIDFISQIEKSKDIDLKNLFRCGDNVQIPNETAPGFLSHKFCPNLWLLGARPHKNDKESMSIIEEVITCSNMLFDYIKLANSDPKRAKLNEPGSQSVYIKAYSELISYLKHLFIYYNKKITEEEIKTFLLDKKWGWTQFFNLIKNREKYDKITIITYNYDIWLERILKALDIKFNIAGFSVEGNISEVIISIIKPHGSISFVPKSEKQFYKINYKVEPTDQNISNLDIKYDEMEGYDKNFLVPPAGDSSRRATDMWAETLRTAAISTAKAIKEQDDVYICGMSYWHVDRRELDELLINLDQDSNVTLLNPFPPNELNAVLVSLFQNYKVFSSSETLKEVLL